VDTVGAGDAFVAGYLSGWLHGLPVADRLRRANACGAILCMTPGDWESSPTLADVERFCQGGDPVLR
jgi:2-dehydro-3-deoxygluconokinase